MPVVGRLFVTRSCRMMGRSAAVAPLIAISPSLMSDEDSSCVRSRRQARAEIEQHLLPFRPRTVTRRAVDVARIADEYKAAPPRVRELARAFDAHELIVGTGDDDARKRQSR